MEILWIIGAILWTAFKKATIYFPEWMFFITALFLSFQTIRILWLFIKIKPILESELDFRKKIIIKLSFCYSTLLALGGLLFILKPFPLNWIVWIFALILSMASFFGLFDLLENYTKEFSALDEVIRRRKSKKLNK